MDNKKNVLILGVGGTGSHAVDLLYSKLEKIGQLSGNRIRAIVFDTDAADLAKIKNATVIPLTDTCTVGTVIDRFNPAFLEEWFPCYRGEDAEKKNMVDGTNYMGQDMATGANQWRKKSYLAFLNLMNDTTRRTKFERALRDMVAEGGQTGLYEIYTVASIAGGTGSGSFIPITLFAKKFLKSLNVEVKTHAMLACPDIYISALGDDAQKTKVYANAYAILKELNAMNQVAFGHNRQSRDGAHLSPIRFRLGHPDDNRVLGVLFDASDEAYWNPSSVPFNKIYLLDRMNGLNSVGAHDNVMASALYSLVGTDIGRALESRSNNLATAQSESDKHNAIYSSIAASELVYPVESILDYIAHKKASVSAEGEWLKIYSEAEAAIADKRAQAKEMGQQYTMPDGGYAKEIGIAVANERRMPTGHVSEILDRGLKTSEYKDGVTVTVDRMPAYFAKLSSELRELLNCESAKLLVATLDERSSEYYKDLPTLGVFAGGEKKQQNRMEFAARVSAYNTYLTEYFKNAVSVIRTQKRFVVKNVFGLGLENPMENKKFSLLYNLFTIDGQYIHPVAAFTLLADLKTYIHAQTEHFKPWEEINSFDDVNSLTLPSDYSTLDDNTPAKKVHESAYVGSDRFVKLANDSESYTNHGGNDPGADSKQLRDDITLLHSKLFKDAHEQILGAVLSGVEKAIDAMLAEYRSFFGTFNEGKKALALKTERLLRADEDTAELVVISATGEDKEEAYKLYNKNEDISEESIRELDHVTGKSVFDLAYAAASAKAAETAAGEINVSGLFDAIVESYKEQIKKSGFYKSMASKTVFEVLTEYYTKRGMKMADIPQKIGEMINRVKDKALPSLHVRSNPNTAASECSALLLHSSLGKYLLDNAKEFGLKMQTEDGVVGEFIGNTGISAEYRLTSLTPPGTIYFTRAIDSIRPTDIEKLNEVGSGATYYQNYKIALINMHAKETDMWNPHLGMELHKHGFLPYINPLMEEEYNGMLAKAVLYTLLEGLITYKAVPRNPSMKVFWYTENGKSKIMYHKGQPVSEKNLAAFVGWLREHDDLVEERAAAFDMRVKQGLRALPLLMGSTQSLTRRITEDEKIIKPLRENLFTAVPGASESKDLALGLIEFAYKIKTSEETERDCDDGEKILKAGFDALIAYCHERVAEEDAVGRIDVYTQQQRKFIAEFIFDDNTQGFSKDTSEVVEYCRLVLEWANKNGCFKTLTFDGYSDVSLGEMLKTPEAALAKKAMDERNKPISFDIPTSFDGVGDTPTEE